MEEVYGGYCGVVSLDLELKPGSQEKHPAQSSRPILVQAHVSTLGKEGRHTGGPFSNIRRVNKSELDTLK